MAWEDDRKEDPDMVWAAGGGAGRAGGRLWAGGRNRHAQKPVSLPPPLSPISNQQHFVHDVCDFSVIVSSHVVNYNNII